MEKKKKPSTTKTGSTSFLKKQKPGCGRACLYPSTQDKELEGSLVSLRPTWNLCLKKYTPPCPNINERKRRQRKKRNRRFYRFRVLINHKLKRFCYFQFKSIQRSQAYSSVLEYLPSIRKTLSLIPVTHTYTKLQRNGLFYERNFIQLQYNKYNVCPKIWKKCILSLLREYLNMDKKVDNNFILSCKLSSKHHALKLEINSGTGCK